MKLERTETISHGSQRYRVETRADPETNVVTTELVYDDDVIDTHTVDGQSKLGDLAETQRQKELDSLARASHEYIKRLVDQGRYESEAKVLQLDSLSKQSADDRLERDSVDHRTQFDFSATAFPRLGPDSNAEEREGTTSKNSELSPAKSGHAGDTLDIAALEMEVVELGQGDTDAEWVPIDEDEIQPVESGETIAEETMPDSVRKLFLWASSREMPAVTWHRTATASWQCWEANEEADRVPLKGESIGGLLGDKEVFVRQISTPKDSFITTLLGEQESLVVLYAVDWALVVVVANSELGMTLNAAESMRK